MMTVAQTVSKAGYRAPKLVVYGGMAALTAGGSRGTAENNGGACNPGKPDQFC